MLRHPTLFPYGQKIVWFGNDWRQIVLDDLVVQLCDFLNRHVNGKITSIKCSWFRTLLRGINRLLHDHILWQFIIYTCLGITAYIFDWCLSGMLVAWRVRQLLPSPLHTFLFEIFQIPIYIRVEASVQTLPWVCAWRWLRQIDVLYGAIRWDLHLNGRDTKLQQSSMYLVVQDVNVWSVFLLAAIKQFD